MIDRNFCLSAGVLSFAGCLTLHAAGSEKKQEKPNIVFIMADDLGWNDLGYTGSDYHETPYIDSLASEGMISRMPMPLRQTLHRAGLAL